MENGTWSGQTSTCKGIYKGIIEQGSVIFELIEEIIVVR